jgi:hypothetical protein
VSASAEIVPTFGVAISLGAKVFGLDLSAEVFNISLPLKLSAAAAFQTPPDAAFTACLQCNAKQENQASLTTTLAAGVRAPSVSHCSCVHVTHDDSTKPCTYACATAWHASWPPWLLCRCPSQPAWGGTC